MKGHRIAIAAAGVMLVCISAGPGPDNWRHPAALTLHEDTLTLVFAGDYMMHKAQLEKGWSESLTRISHKISAADIAVANMEFPLGGAPYSGYPAFSAPDDAARHAADNGVDIFLAANNHILDRGKAGMLRTMEIYDNLEDDGTIRYTGIGRDSAGFAARNPLIVEQKGMRLAFVNCTYGTNVGGPDWPRAAKMNKDELSAAFQRARDAGADFVIALPHWGTEYVLKHGKGQEDMAKWMAQEGADLIVGTHPHVVQDSMTVHVQEPERRDVPVWFSLGNIVSNMSAENTRVGLMLTVKLLRRWNGKVRLLSTEPEFTWCTLPGRLGDRHSTIFIKQYEGKRELWKIKYDYDNMMKSYSRVKKMTDIKDEKEHYN